jgi:hypothetical protein
MFCINLSGIGLDFHPCRGPKALGMGGGSNGGVSQEARRRAQTLATYLYDEVPAEPEKPVFSSIPNDAVFPEAPVSGMRLDCGASLEQAREDGASILEVAGAHLARLLEEIYQRSPLPEGGAIPQKTRYP